MSANAVPSMYAISGTLPKRLIIATRASRLAMWQAEHVKARLEAHYPGCEVRLLGMTTRGDQILDRSLSKLGGKGLFIKELEVALLEGRADLAVHSLKDVPMVLEPAFTLAALLERAEPRDAFISTHYSALDSLPDGAIVGTSSMRRAAQIAARYPRLRIQPLRGNLDTRLEKLARGDYQAIILAAAGLQRLGLTAHIRSILPTAISLPAVGQGVLGIEILQTRQDVQAWLAPLHHRESALCVTAERAVARELGGSCQVPLAAYAQLQGQELCLQALVAAPDGKTVLAEQAQVTLDPSARDALTQAVSLGHAVAAKLLAAGAQTILQACLLDSENRSA